MKRIYLIAAILCLFALSATAQMQNYEDVVYLKNGSIIHGTIIEQVPNQTIKIKTKAGSVFVYNVSDVEKTTKEQIVRTQPQRNIRPPKPKKIYDSQTFIIGGAGIHPSQLSFYTMVGYVKTFGFYGKLKTNFNFDSSYDNDIYSSENIFVQSTKTGRFSITGGGMIRLSNPLSLYAGAGYGSRWLNWISTSDEVYRLDDYSHTGIEAEAGAIFKLKNIYINAGVQTNSFAYMELNLGVGINLDILKSKKK